MVLIKLFDILLIIYLFFSLTSVVLQVFYKYVDGQFLCLFPFSRPCKLGGMGLNC